MPVAVFLQLLFFSRGLYSIGWDESARTLDAYSWANHGTVLTSAWLPFYRILVGLAMKVFPDLFLTPRIISLAFGLIAIAASDWLASEIFQSRKTTLVTVALSVFFSQRIVLSLAPVSSIMFTATIVTSMAALARWLRTYDRQALWICALAAALAGAIRYEGWVFAVAILFAAASGRASAPEKVKSSDIASLGLILFSFPVIWIAVTCFTTNPIHTVIQDASRFSTREILLKNPIFEFVSTNAVSMNLIGAVAVFQAVRRGNRRQRTIVAAFFSPLICISLGLLFIRSAQTGPSWRDICVWSMLMIPFTASLLSGAVWPFPEGQTGKVLRTSLLLMVVCASMYDVVRIRKESAWAFPESDRRAGTYLNALIAAAPNQRILVESSTFVYLNIEVASQHPDAFTNNSVPERPSVPILSAGGSVKKAVADLGIRFLAFQSDQYKNALNRNPEVTKLRDFGSWSIYQVLP